MKVVELTGKSQILAYLETDRLYSAYAVGDLEPALFAHCEWFGAEREGRLQALALHYGGLGFPIVFLMGDADGLGMMRDFYEWEPLPMWRMALWPESSRPVTGDCVSLTRDHAEQLAALYACGEGNAFDPVQVPGGAFHGIFEDGRLVAAAGTHLISPTYGVAAVGNVLTHPGCRGQGCATAATSAVVAELQGRGIRDIVLNVSQKNATAIRIYERLGFERYCSFFEGSAVR